MLKNIRITAFSIFTLFLLAVTSAQAADLTRRYGPPPGTTEEPDWDFERLEIDLAAWAAVSYGWADLGEYKGVVDIASVEAGLKRYIDEHRYFWFRLEYATALEDSVNWSEYEAGGCCKPITVVERSESEFNWAGFMVGFGFDDVFNFSVFSHRDVMVGFEFGAGAALVWGDLTQATTAYDSHGVKLDEAFLKDDYLEPVIPLTGRMNVAFTDIEGLSVFLDGTYGIKEGDHIKLGRIGLKKTWGGARKPLE